MIIQQVNLYQEILKPKQLHTDIFIYLSVIVTFVLALLSFSLYLQHDLHETQNVSEKAQTDLNSQKAIVKQLQNKLPKQQTDTALLAETKQWQKKVTDLTQTLALLDNETAMQTQGFSAYFLALSNQAVSGVWLTVIHFDASQELINFEGSTYTADKIPLFLQHLQTEPTFQGRSFAKLTVEKSAQPPHLMNFKLSTHLPVIKKSHAE